MPSEPSEPSDGRRTLVDLNGTWSAQASDHNTAGDTDGQWEPVPVPGHWQRSARFASAAGPMRYRTAFEVPPQTGSARRWLMVDGVFYQADIWLDDSYLGDPEGYFSPAAFEITDLVSDGHEHDLELEITCPGVSSDHVRSTITGSYQDFIDRTWNPGGIAGGVTVYETGPVRIDRLRVLCRDADPLRAHLILTARLDAASERPVRIRTLADTTVLAEFEHSVARGSNEVEWSLDISEPALWWPRALGDPQLVQITVEVITQGRCSDRIERTTGLREVAWDRWICSINGERLFIKGADLVPIRLDAASVTDDAIERLLGDAVDAGLDAVRIHAHIAPAHLYTTADRLGLLVLQDFPLVGLQSRRIRAQATEQAVAAVDHLGHHPSLVLWWAHDRSEHRTGTPSPAQNTTTGGETRGDDDRPRRPGLLRRFIAEQRPDVNRVVLDRWVKQAFERADPTRPCIAQSGSLPHLPLLDGTDSHLWFGWSDGEIEGLASVARRLPRLVRFVSEFGSQSVPAVTDFIDTGRWPDLDWAALADRHGAQVDELLTRFDPADHRSFTHFQRATQAHQARVVKYSVETLRRLKYRPTGGFCVFALNDPAPAISFSIIDHTGARLPAFDALRESCQPLLGVADLLATPIEPGRHHRVNIHLINDLRHRVEAATIEITATCDDVTLHRWAFAGDIDADRCERVARIDFDVPDNATCLEVAVVVSADGHRAVNHYALSTT